LHATAWNNLGLALNAAVRLPEAVKAYREAIACKPDFAQAHWNLSLALLTGGLLFLAGVALYLRGRPAARRLVWPTR